MSFEKNKGVAFALPTLGPYPPQDPTIKTKCKTLGKPQKNLDGSAIKRGRGVKGLPLIFFVLFFLVKKKFRLQLSSRGRGLNGTDIQNITLLFLWLPLPSRALTPKMMVGRLGCTSLRFPIQGAIMPPILPKTRRTESLIEKLRS